MMRGFPFFLLGLRLSQRTLILGQMGLAEKSSGNPLIDAFSQNWIVEI